MSVDKTIKELEDPDEQVRLRAVAKLAKNVDLRAVGALMKVCKHDPSLEVRFYAKRALVFYRERLVKEKAVRSSGAASPGEGPAHGGPAGNAGPVDPTDERDEADSPACGKAPGPATGERAGAIVASLEELDGLYHELEHGESAARIKAIMALVQLKDKGLLPRLRSLLTDEADEKVKAALVLALGLLGRKEDVPLVKSCLECEYSRLRANAVEALALLDGVDAVGEICTSLKDPSRKVKNAALEALRSLDKRELLQRLQSMLAEEDSAARDCAAYALVKLEDPFFLPLIVSILSDPEITIRLKARNALVVLAKNGCPEAHQALSRHAGDRASPDSFMTMSVIQLRPKLDKLGDPRPRERIRAVAEIVEKGEASRVPGLLQALLREKDPYVRATIILALGKLRAEDAVATLKIFLEDPDTRIRANAVEALGLIGGGEVYPLLIPFLEDPNNRIRANAVIGLGRCPYIQLELPLKQMVRSEEVLMRRSAVYAVVELRREEYVPLLAELLEDNEPIVRERALDALKVLAAEGFESAGRLLAEAGV